MYALGSYSKSGINHKNVAATKSTQPQYTETKLKNLICFSINRRSLTSTHPYHSVEWNVYTSEQTSTSASVGDSISRFFRSAVLPDHTASNIRYQYTQAVANFVGTVPAGFPV